MSPINLFHWFVILQTLIGFGNSGNIQYSSRHMDIHYYVIDAFESAKKEIIYSKGPNVFKKRPINAKPMIMQPNFHQLVAHPTDERSVIQQTQLADLRQKSMLELSRMTGIPVKDILNDRYLTQALEKQFETVCRPIVGYIHCDEHAKYRTINGTCNNLVHPEWGSSSNVERRYLPAAYEDGLCKPRMLDVRGKPLPSPRKISNSVFKGGSDTRLDNDNTVFVMSWGQMIDHELISTPVLKKDDGSDFKCCGKDRYFEGCIPISIPRYDPHFNRDCMSLVRSAPAVGRVCSMDVRQQLNIATSYLDGSAIYGSTVKDMDFLRQKKGGLLKTGPFNLLPKSNKENCMKETRRDYCQIAGDDRPNVVPSLGSIHTVFMREHNRIAKALSRINPHWDDERIFQESRKIVSGLLQQITYTEYLPIILGSRNVNKFDLASTRKGFSDMYNSHINAGTTNVFGAAAFRFGHTNIPKMQTFMRYRSKQRKDVLLEKTFHRPKFVQANNGMGCRENLVWLLNDKQAKTDRVIEKGVRDLLFLKDGISLDLSAINIQRARDHGIPSYNAWRKWCNLPVARNFYGHYTGLVDHTRFSARLLRNVYRHPDNIDLFAGALSEKIVRGGKVGPTFACILGRQFRDYKLGDRFWYERYDEKTGFTLDQLNSLKKVKFSKVICQNANLPTIQPNAFLLPVRRLRNDERRCSELPGLDLYLWREYEKVDSYEDYYQGRNPYYNRFNSPYQTYNDNRQYVRKSKRYATHF